MFQSLRRWSARRSVVASLAVLAALLGVMAASLVVTGARVLAAQADPPEWSYTRPRPADAVPSGSRTCATRASR